MEVYLDDAGTGCIIGKAVIVGIRGSVVKHRVWGNKSVSEMSFDILEDLGASKEDTLHLCRGNVFNGFSNDAVLKGYSIVREQIDGENQDIVENVFMESIYDLGLPKSVKLDGKDYHKLQDDIVNEILAKPELLEYVRVHFYKTRQYNAIYHALDRLTNEFPNLYNELVSKDIRDCG